jgi:hypothetical protein
LLRILGSDTAWCTRGRWPVRGSITAVAVVPLVASAPMVLVAAVVAIVIMVDVDDPRAVARLSVVHRLPVVAWLRC